VEDDTLAGAATHEEGGNEFLAHGASSLISAT
jgi:hypothetical protein